MGMGESQNELLPQVVLVTVIFLAQFAISDHVTVSDAYPKWDCICLLEVQKVLFSGIMIDTVRHLCNWAVNNKIQRQRRLTSGNKTS